MTGNDKTRAAIARLDRLHAKILKCIEHVKRLEAEGARIKASRPTSTDDAADQ